MIENCKICSASVLSEDGKYICTDPENINYGNDIQDIMCCSFDSPMAETVKDNVNHPSHYETGKFECIDVMLETQGIEAVKSFCICNAFKYLYRHKNKNGLEDVKKAEWYIKKYIELEEGSENESRK